MKEKIVLYGFLTVIAPFALAMFVLVCAYLAVVGGAMLILDPEGFKAIYNSQIVNKLKEGGRP